MRKLSTLLLISLTFLPTPARAQESEPTLFDNVVAKLQKNFVDEEFRNNQLPQIVERYRERAAKATTMSEQRQVTHELLSNLPATHMGLLSQNTYQYLVNELGNKPQPMFGFELMNLDGKYFAHNVLERGPAWNSGLRRGDRITLIDGQEVASHSRVDWRSDDSYLADPPTHLLLAEEGDSIRLHLETQWGKPGEISITASPWSSFQSAEASAKIIEVGEYKFAHVHFWLVHMTGVADLLKEKLEGEFADCDALIIDLRGRGGNGMALPGIYDVLTGKKSTWKKPVIALVNEYSRSAKEVIAYEMKAQNIALVVGERTAGAVIPASFVDVGFDTMLMYPTFRMGKYTNAIEGIGVEPNVLVKDAGPYSHGADPLLEAAIEQARRIITR